MMTNVKKTALKGKSKRKSVEYNRFSTLYDEEEKGTLHAVDSLNCTTADGALTAGVGISIFYTANEDEVEYTRGEPKSYYIYKEPQYGTEYFGIMPENGNAVYLDEDEMKLNLLSNYMYYMDTYNCVNQDFEDVLVVAGGVGIFEYAKSGQLVSSLSNIQCSCMCKDRLYVMVRNYQLRYSTPLEYLSFNQTLDDSGILYLPTNYGEPKGMAAYRDNVYVFYEQHIMELKTAGAARDFKLSELPYTGGKILDRMMKVFGDKLFFLTEEGGYIFDGKVFKKAYSKLNILPEKNGRTFCSAVCDGKLVVRYVDKNLEDKTVVLYSDGEYGYYTTVLKGIGEYKGKAFCLYKNKFYNIMDGMPMPSGEFRYFHSSAQDFGVKGRKTLKTLHFEGVSTIQFDVYVDGVRKVRNAFAKYDDMGRASFNLDLRGEEFSFVIYIASAAKLYRMTADVEYV